MNIIIVARLPSLPITDGYSYYLVNRIKYFKDKNYKIYFYTTTPMNSDSHDLLELRRYCEELHSYKHNKLGRLLMVFFRFWLPVGVSIVLSRKMKKNIADCLSRNYIDVILVEYPFLLINIPNDSNVPVILTQHNLEFDKIKKISKYHGIFKIFVLHESRKLKKYEEKHVKEKNVSLYTFISEKNKTEFEDIFGVNNTYLLPVGYNIHVRCQSVYQEGKIVFVGAMDAFQNKIAVEWFVNKIFPAIIKDYTNVKLYIIGKNPTNEILSLSSENIIVTGTVDKIDNYINDAHLYIIPLVFGDGVKIKTLEAFATGNIVVSTSIGIEGISFIPGHEYILADTENEFIESCKHVLKCRRNYEYLAINALKKVQELYSWDSILESYENKIKEIARKRAGSQI